MLAYKQGDADAFNMLYARHKGALYRYFMRHLSGRQDLVNELFQDVWMRLIKARGDYQASAKFTTYLYRIAHNRLVDHWRSQKLGSSDINTDSLPDESMPLPEQNMYHDQLNRQLQAQIEALPQDQRNTFLLRQEAAFTLEQIADITGVNRETVKSRLRYAMDKLKQSLAFLS